MIEYHNKKDSGINVNHGTDREVYNQMLHTAICYFLNCEKIQESVLCND